MRTLPLAVVGVTVLALSTACQSRICTLQGGWSQVAFDDVASAFPDDLPYDVRACAGDECVDWRGVRAEAAFLSVPLGDVSAPTTVTATLTLTLPVDPPVVVFDDSTSVDLTIYQPNGPGCDPTVFQGTVRVTTDGELVPVARLQ